MKAETSAKLYYNENLNRSSYILEKNYTDADNNIKKRNYVRVKLYTSTQLYYSVSFLSKLEIFKKELQRKSYYAFTSYGCI